jgi:hypothetical protein
VASSRFCLVEDFADQMQYLYNIGSRVYNAVASIPADISRRLFRGVLNELLGPYLKDKLQLEDLDAQFGDGVFTFRDLVLEEDMINKKLGSVKLTCRFARIDFLAVSAPYDLEVEDLRIEARGLTIVLSTSSDSDLFRSAFSSAGGSMMQSIVLPSDEGGEEGEEDERPQVEGNVYVELQENIADLLGSLKLQVSDCRVLVENKGHVFEFVMNHMSLVDTRELDTYTITADDVSFSSICAKLGIESLSLPLPPFGVGEVVRVPDAIDNWTCRVVQKSFRFHGLFASYLGLVPVGLNQSGAGEDLLVTLEKTERTSLFSFDGSENNLFILELSDDKRIWCNVTLQNETVPLSLKLTPEVYAQVMAVVESLVDTGSSDDDNDLVQGSRDHSEGTLLSDFSILYHQQKGSVIGNGPLQFASVFSDWSLLKSYGDTLLLRFAAEVPLLVIELQGPEMRAAVTVRNAKVAVASADNLLQWSLELDGGLTCVDGDVSLISVFPGALPLSLKGEVETDNSARKMRVSVDHCSPIVLRSEVSTYMGDVAKIFSGASEKQLEQQEQQQESSGRSTIKLEWKLLSLQVDSVYEVSCGDVSLMMELPSLTRVMCKASSAELRVEGVEMLSVKEVCVGLFWKSKGGSSSVAPVNDAAKLIAVPFEGMSAIWGSKSSNLKLTQSFVSSFASVARSSELHVDFRCESFVANVDQAKVDRVLVWMQQPAEGPMPWTSWAVSIGGDCVVALLHESLARHDYCWSALTMFGSVGFEQQDCNFFMVDGKRTRFFVSNPSANVPRVLLWQKLSVTEDAKNSNLDSIELTNLRTCLVVGRVSVTRSPDVRIVLRSCAISPVATHWMLAGDFFGGPAAEEEDVEEEIGREEKWLLQAENVAMLIHAGQSAHAILCLSTAGVVFSQSGRRAWQMSADLGLFKCFLSNRDTLPPSHRYLDLSQFASSNGSGYRVLASLGGVNIGLMKDESIAVNLLNFQGQVLEMRTCADSLATAIVLIKHWSTQFATQERMGSLRQRSREANVMEGSTDSLVFSDRLDRGAGTAGEPVPEKAPSLAIIKTHLLEVHLFLLEQREEYRVGSTVRVRWEYRKGVSTEYDWVAMYKTTRSRKSKNYYAESLTGGKKFSVLEFKVPNKLGSIHFRFFRGSGLDNLVAVSESFRVGPEVELTVTRVKSSLYVERVIVKNHPSYGWRPKPTDWIGLYQWNQSNKNLPYHNTFKKVGDLSSVSFAVPVEPGRFVFRYFADMGWGQNSEVARSHPFAVSASDAAQMHDLVSRSASDKQPKEHWQVSDFHVKWTFADGSDWKFEDSPRKKDEVMLQVQVPMSTLSFMSSRAKHSVQVYLTLGMIELHDRVARSNYRSLLQFPSAKRAANVPCVQVQLGKLRHLQDEERWECRVDVAPLWLNVDQDTLIFVLRCGLATHELVCAELFVQDEPDPMEQSFVLLPGETVHQQQHQEQNQAERTFETLSISAVDVEIDFRAKNRRMDTLLMNSRHGIEAMYRLLYFVSGLLSVNESRLFLDTVLLRNVKQSELAAVLSREWFPQIQRDNISSLVSGFEPVKFVFRLGEARSSKKKEKKNALFFSFLKLRKKISIGLIQAPMQSENVFSGLAEGGANLGKTIYVEAFRGLSNFLVGTGNVVKNVNRLAEGTGATGTAAVAPHHVKAHSPVDLQEGFTLAGQEIVRGFQDAFAGVFYAPLAAYNETGSASDAVVQVVRGMPGLVLKPIGSIFRASSIPLRFVAASADPTITQRAALKYKKPELETQAEEQEQAPNVKKEEDVQI